jgi:Na+-driven multidrug efflux pump
MLKKFIKYVSQNMLGMVGMSVYILADTYFISVAVGADGITALNLVLPIYNIIFAIGAMMGVGSAIRFVVERNKKSPDADGYFFHALVWAFIISLFFIFVGLFLPDKLIALLGGDAQIVATGKNYTRIFMCFAPFFMWNYICNAFVRNDGNPSIAMSATLFSSLFNIVFDYVFMFPAGLGLTGAALATAFCPLVTMIICSTHYLGKHNQVGFHFRAPSLRHLIACCQLGVSAFVGEISSAVIAIVFNFLLLGLAGNVGVAAYGVTANLSVVAMCLFNGLAQGTQPLISESYGKGDHTQSRQFLTWGVIACLIVEALILVLTWSMTDPLIQIFNQEQNAELLHYAHSGLRLYFLGFLFAGINILLVAYFSAIDRARPAVLGSVMRGIIAIAFCAILFSQILGLNGIWLSFLGSEIITFFVILIFRKS